MVFTDFIALPRMGRVLRGKHIIAKQDSHVLIFCACVKALMAKDLMVHNETLESFLKDKQHIHSLQAA